MSYAERVSRNSRVRREGHLPLRLSAPPVQTTAEKKDNPVTPHQSNYAADGLAAVLASKDEFAKGLATAKWARECRGILSRAGRVRGREATHEHWHWH